MLKAVEHFVELNEVWDKPEKAARWRSRLEPIQPDATDASHSPDGD